MSGYLTAAASERKHWDGLMWRRTYVVDARKQPPQFPNMRQSKEDTAHDLAKGLWTLRALAIRLDLKVVGALIKVAIGLIPTSMH